MNIKKLLSLALGVIMLCGVIPTSYAQGEEDVQTSIIIQPTVMINAGTRSGYSPKFDYSAAGHPHALMIGKPYDYPNQNVEAGIFLRWQLPAIPEGYEVKRAYFIGGHYHTSQFKSDGYQNGSAYIYHLKGDIEEDFIYHSDTATYPDKNLATLIPTGSGVHKVTSKFRFRGKTTNYYDKVQDDTLFYSVGMSVKGYTQNLYKASNGEAIDLSTLMISSNELTFNGSKDLDYGPVVWYMEIDKPLDAEFTNPDQVAAGKDFDAAIDVSILDERVASVVFNVNGANYTATLSDGKWTSAIPGLDIGEYTVKATITDIYENVLEKSQNITVAAMSDPVQITEVDMEDYNGKAWDVVINEFDNSNTYVATFTDNTEEKSGEIDFRNVEADGGSLAFAIFLHTTRANVALDIVTE